MNTIYENNLKALKKKMKNYGRHFIPMRSNRRKVGLLLR